MSPSITVDALAANAGKGCLSEDFSHSMNMAKTCTEDLIAAYYAVEQDSSVINEVGSDEGASNERCIPEGGNNKGESDEGGSDSCGNEEDGSAKQTLQEQDESGAWVAITRDVAVGASVQSLHYFTLFWTEQELTTQKAGFC